MTGAVKTAVLEVSGVHWASSKPVTEAVLSRRPGVLAVDANPVAQTATVTYDAARTNVAELAGWIRDCGYHCAGQSVPAHVCDPMAEPAADTGRPEGDHGHGPATGRTRREVMGHGGHHGGMSMDAMVAGMRNRFLVAAVLSVPNLLWSLIGRDVVGSRPRRRSGCATTSARCCCPCR